MSAARRQPTPGAVGSTPPRAAARPKKSKGPWARRTYLASAVVFAGTLGALGAQVHAGADPAIKPVAVVHRPTLVVTRKVVVTKVVTKRVIHHKAAPVVAGPVASTVSTVSTAAAPTYVAPAVSSSAAPAPAAPVTAAPAPVVSRAPAAAAPVTKRS